MKVKTFFVAVCCFAAAGAAYCADMAALYEKASASLKGEEIFLESELVSSNFMERLNNLYYSSVYENPSEYSELLSLKPEDLDRKIIKELKSVDFDEVVRTVRADTKVEPLPKTIGGGKLTGIKVRRWFKTSRKAESEIKAKRELLLELKRDFAFFEKNYSSLKTDLKVKFYVYVRQAVRNINVGNYVAAKEIADYISERYYKVRYKAL